MLRGVLIRSLWRRFGWLVLLGLSWCVGGSCSAPVAPVPTPTPEAPSLAPSPLRMTSPESLLPALRAASAVYQREERSVEITVIQRADPLALRAVQHGDVDLAALTWLTQALPEDLWARPLSRDGLAIVVHPQNGLPGLTMSQLQDLFQGRLEDWATWGGLPGTPLLVSRDASSGDYAFFQAWAMRDARVSLNALMAPSSEAVLAYVDADPLGVGYVSTARLDGRVRAVAVNGVPPVRETMAAGLYPLTRTHFIVTPTEPEGAVRAFVEWLLTPPGQSVLSAHGLVPAPE